MNIDFHYYGTLAAALDAGYTIAEAEIVAYSAQLVDDFTESNCGNEIKEYVGNTIKYTCISTRHNLAFVNDKKNKLSHIWMPFHFLPALNRSACIAHNAKLTCLNRVPLLTMPDNVLVDQMILSCLRGKSLFALVQQGLMLHVIADTYAHSNFAGKYSETLNQVSDYTINNHSQLPLNAGCIGHGALQFSPDEPSLTFLYKPSWSNSTITRNNPTIFALAYNNMYNFLRSMQGNASPISSNYIDAIYNDILTHPSDQIPLWKNFITQNFGVLPVKDYDPAEWRTAFARANIKSTDKYFYFAYSAQQQWNLVNQYVDMNSPASIRNPNNIK